MRKMLDKILYVVISAIVTISCVTPTIHRHRNSLCPLLRQSVLIPSRIREFLNLRTLCSNLDQFCRFW